MRTDHDAFQRGARRWLAVGGQGVSQGELLCAIL